MTGDGETSGSDEVTGDTHPDPQYEPVAHSHGDRITAKANDAVVEGEWQTMKQLAQEILREVEAHETDLQEDTEDSGNDDDAGTEIAYVESGAMSYLSVRVDGEWCREVRMYSDIPVFFTEDDSEISLRDDRDEGLILYETPEGAVQEIEPESDVDGVRTYEPLSIYPVDTIEVHETFECRKCGAKRKFTGESIRCYGTAENPHHNDPVDVVRPCGVCGKPITTAEICQKCADDRETNAFTHPNEAWEEATGGNNGA